MENTVLQKEIMKKGYPIYAIIGISLLYVICGKFSLSFATINPSASIFWLPTSLAFASFLIFGFRIWPAIFIGAFFVNFSTTDHFLSSLAIAVGNTLEGMVAAYLINRYALGLNVFSRIRPFFKFVLLGALLSTMISATIGILSLSFSGLADWAEFMPIWTTWWLGNAAGALIFTPAIILWVNSPRPRLLVRKLVEFMVMTVAAFIMLWVILSSSFSLSYLIMLVLIWLITRFHPKEVAAFLALFSLITILSASGSTLIVPTEDRPLVFIQQFIAILTLSAMPISIAIQKQKIAKWNQDQLAFILESSSEAVVGKTLDGTITYWNSAAEDLYGYKKEEMIGANVTLLIPDEKLDEFWDIMEKIRLDDRIDNFETTRIHKDGKRIQLRLKNSPIIDDRGNIVGVTTMATDITQEKKKERLLYEEKLKAVEQVRQEFIQNAAHELRTPLAIIKGNMDLTQRLPAKASNIRDTFEVIDSEVKHLSNIITNLITLSSAKREPPRKRKDQPKILITPIIRNVVSKYENTPGKKITTDLSAIESAAMFGDKENLSKLFANLMDNAIAYTGENGEITISGQRRGKNINIIVADNGFGITEAELPHVFEEFFRTEKSREKGLGTTGLGLSLVKSITEAHGGGISVKSTEGKGSTFTITLPEAL